MNSAKLPLIIGVAVLVLIILIIASAILFSKRNTNPLNQPVVSPTVAIPTGLPDQEVKSFTGEREVTFAPPTLALIDQKEALRNKVPVNQSEFLIDFDYATDTFTVQLKGDKDASTKAFNDWLQKNYPGIPLDRFIIQ